MIFDANILIYLSKKIIEPKAILTNSSSISVITKIEALGYAFSDIDEHNTLLAMCNLLPVVSLTDDIAEATIMLRKKYRIKLADAIIYSTALIEKKPLLTNNIQDFKSLDEGVELIAPFTL